MKKHHAVLCGLVVLGAAWGCNGGGGGASSNASTTSPVTSGTGPVTSGSGGVVTSGSGGVVASGSIGRTTSSSTGSTTSSSTGSTTTASTTTAPVTERYLYVSNSYGGSIGAFSIDATTGRLKKIANFLCLGGSPNGLATDKAQKFIFAAVTGAATGPSSTVLTYSIDTTSGFLTLMAGAQPTLGTDPQHIVLDPTGAFLLVPDDQDDTITSLSVDAKTGALKVAAKLKLPTGTGVSRLVVSPDSKFVYVTGSGLGDLTTCSFEVGTGKLAVVGKPILKNLKSVGPIAMDPKGQFVYVATADDTTTPPGAVYAYKRNAGTGALTALGKQVTYNKALAQSIVVDASGKNCYVACDSTDYVYAYTIGTTGALTANTPSAAKTGQTPSSLVIDATGKYAFAPCQNTDDLQMLTVDPANGALHDNGNRLKETQGDAPTSLVLVK